MGKYYEDHPDQLSEKLTDQYECELPEIIAIVFFIIIIIGSFFL